MAGQLIRRGENTWCVRVYTGRDAHGKRSYINQTVHGTKREADQELRKLLAQRDTGRLHVKPKQSVDEYLDVWLETVVRPSVRQRTLHSYDEALRLYVRPNLGRLRLASVTPIEVRAMLVKLRDRGLSPRTVRKAHEVLRNALEQAVADCLIPENPARSRLVKKALPRTEREERQTIGVEAIGAFLAAAAANRLYAYWCVLLFGGLRPSEALALRWEDVRGDAVQVNRVLVDVERREMYFAPPKSKKPAGGRAADGRGRGATRAPTAPGAGATAGGAGMGRSWAGVHH